MMRLPLVVLLLCASVAAADDATARKFLKELEGNYTPVRITKGGEPLPDAEFKAVAIIAIKGDTLTVRFKKGDKDEDKAATLVVDPGQTPVALDMTPKDGPDASKPVLGIVKVERDTVTICWGDRADKAERPKEFNSTKENRNFLIVMKKAR